MSFYSRKYYKIKNLDKEKDIVYIRFFSDVTGKILDVGCSVGNFISLDPSNIIGIDIDRDALKICKKRGFEVYYNDLNKKLRFPNNFFSAIHCRHVIEHLPNPLRALKEFHRILKKNGKLVIFTVNIKKVGFDFWDDYSHKTPLTKKSLYQLLYDAGFREIFVDNNYIGIRGASFLIEKNIVKPTFIIKLQNLLYRMGIKAKKGIIGIAKK